MTIYAPGSLDHLVHSKPHESVLALTGIMSRVQVAPRARRHHGHGRRKSGGGDVITDVRDNGSGR